jgi:hypothetical protein
VTELQVIVSVGSSCARVRDAIDALDHELVWGEPSERDLVLVSTSADEGESTAVAEGLDQLRWPSVRQEVVDADILDWLGIQLLEGDCLDVIRPIKECDQ